MTKIALIDDHKLLRKGLANLVTDQGYTVILQADNGEHFIEQLDAQRLPDLVLLDINMPIRDGYETLQWIQENHPGMHVIALSMYDQETSVIRMLKAGAKGYLMKDCEPDEVRRAIDAVMKKGYYHSELVSARLIHHLQKGGGDDDIGANGQRRLTLTKREMEFLRLICTDLTYKEIADRLFVSPRTIDGYRDDLFEKLNIKSRVGLAMYAIKNEIVKI